MQFILHWTFLEANCIFDLSNGRINWRISAPDYDVWRRTDRTAPIPSSFAPSIFLVHVASALLMKYTPIDVRHRAGHEVQQWWTAIVMLLGVLPSGSFAIAWCMAWLLRVRFSSADAVPSSLATRNNEQRPAKHIQIGKLKGNLF